MRREIQLSGLSGSTTSSWPPLLSLGCYGDWFPSMTSSASSRGAYPGLMPAVWERPENFLMPCRFRLTPSLR